MEDHFAFYVQVHGPSHSCKGKNAAISGSIGRLGRRRLLRNPPKSKALLHVQDSGSRSLTAYCVYPKLLRPSDLHNLDLNIMLVSSRLRDEATTIMYSHTLRFLGSAESAYAFLHDHSRLWVQYETLPTVLKHVSYSYRTIPEILFKGERIVDNVYGAATNNYYFHQMFNVFVHRMPNFESFHLVIDPHFWDSFL
ncbi:hypothetical protein EJ08DRAFT_676649 [Tothia fuscella]|uniref:Uncharacterized protein n=1 Tax=Tothia fuscella TaxID=1048955 RepID=A0A9P4U1G9_9PEZI|nr:hypothetical protein EJ08DRAFT_676649 [Tothia fuscella]